MNNQPKFRLLRADEIEVRQSRATDKYVDLLLYKTSRTDVDILNETVGALNWTNDYDIDTNGHLWAKIGIWDDNKKDYVWNTSAGTESNVEKVKGEDSDSFKRAGYRWGIGAELYSSPLIRLNPGKHYQPKVDGKGTWDTFSVVAIDCNEAKRIEKLVIRNNDTGAVWHYGFDAKSPTLKNDILESVERAKQYKQDIINSIREES